MWRSTAWLIDKMMWLKREWFYFVLFYSFIYFLQFNLFIKAYHRIASKSLDSIVSFRLCAFFLFSFSFFFSFFELRFALHNNNHVKAYHSFVDSTLFLSIKSKHIKKICKCNIACILFELNVSKKHYQHVFNIIFCATQKR